MICKSWNFSRKCCDQVGQQYFLFQNFYLKDTEVVFQADLKSQMVRNDKIYVFIVIGLHFSGNTENSCLKPSFFGVIHGKIQQQKQSKQFEFFAEFLLLQLKKIDSNIFFLKAFNLSFQSLPNTTTVSIILFKTKMFKVVDF